MKIRRFSKLSALITCLLFAILLLVSACDSTTEPDEGIFPYNLNLEKLQNSQLKLTWDYPDAGSDTLFFYIDRKAGESGWTSSYAVTADNTREFIDYVPTTDTLTYAYRIQCENYSQGTLSLTSDVIAWFSEYTYPTEMQFEQISQEQVLVTWNDNCIGEDGYIVDRKLNDEDWDTGYLYLPPNTDTFSDYISLFDNITYRLYAHLGISRTEYLADTLFTTLLPPSNLSAVTLDVNKIRITWQDNSSGEDGFAIDKRIGELPWQTEYVTLNENDTTYVDDVTLPCGTFSYRLRAFKNQFYSPYSNTSQINVQLELIGAFDTAGDPLHVYLPVENQYIPEWTAFVADNYQGLALVDCHNPTAPSEITVYQDLWGDRTLTSCVSGNFAYVATQSLTNAAGGIQKINIADLQNPVIYSVTETQGIPKDIYVEADFAYLAEGQNGLSIMYVAASTPAFCAQMPLYDARRVVVKMINGTIYAFVANGLNNGLEVIDVNDPYNPVSVASLPLEGIASDLTLTDEYLFLANGEEGLEIINITAPENPLSLKTVNTGGFVNGVFYHENYVYLSDLENGIYVVDAQNPADSYILGYLALDSQPTTVQLSGSYLYITDNENLKIIKVKP